jgi:predicted Rossmann-fold nucleotide-binding protein
VRRHRGRIIDVETIEDFDRRLAEGACDLSGWRVRGLDLSGRIEGLEEDCRLSGATFLGCTFGPGEEAQVAAAGALVLPAIADVPVDVYRGRLYSPEELYDDPSYARTLDGRAYSWAQDAHERDDSLAIALHDYSIDDALASWTAPRHLVGVMGGHTAHRDTPAYADAARLGRLLGRHHVVATGGGPGSMEAANLGASLAAEPGEALDDALELLAGVPSYRPSVDAWLHTAFEVRHRHSDPTESLGIPTWHYGHEPPNVFATAIAKYFGNPTREAILLEVCDSGIVFLEGSGGTVQEIFQDACENYYADESSVAPMVLVGRAYWTDTLPAWPLLRSLARGRVMEDHVHLVDTVEEAADVVSSPVRPGS